MDASLTVCLGGERCPQPLLDAWASRVTLLNTYGTTECHLPHLITAEFGFKDV